jgi:hypothetical protein
VFPLTCQAPTVKEIDGLRSDIMHLEQQFDLQVEVYIGSMAVIRQDDAGAAVKTDVNISIPEPSGGTSVQRYAFQFTVVQESGWRVCSAVRLG